MKNTWDKKILEASLVFIEQTVGRDWIEEWVHNIRDNFERTNQYTPPLAMMWLKAKEELAMGELTGFYTPSDKMLHLAELGDNLKTLRGVTGFKGLIPLLKGDMADFINACRILGTAADYIDKRQIISFKGADIIVHYDQAD